MYEIFLLTGRQIEREEQSPLVQLTCRTISFRWQRGTKLGEGSFGQVYTCVNIDTGKILAMKEVIFYFTVCEEFILLPGA